MNNFIFAQSSGATAYVTGLCCCVMFGDGVECVLCCFSGLQLHCNSLDLVDHSQIMLPQFCQALTS